MTVASEKYEGLSLPQLLDLMHEIDVPEAVSWTLQTKGWLVLGCWLLAVSILSLIKVVLRHRRNRYRRVALELVDQVNTHSDNPGAAGEIAAIVKRTALVAYSRDDVASLCGPGWAQFLYESSGNDSRMKESVKLIAAAAYRPGVDAQELVEPAKRWIRTHHA